ncbi:MAG: nucleoside-diphosphate kinase [Verrucomicrobiota bacterium]
METTLILLKPDCVQKGHCGDVVKRFEAEGFKIRGAKMMALSNEILAEHYAHIADKPFFPNVQSFMQQCPVIAMALQADNAVQRVRDLLGPTNSKEAAPGTIRGDYGVDMMVNVVHASDSSENALIELQRFFQDGELFDY